MSEQGQISPKRILPMVVLLMVVASGVVVYLISLESSEKKRLEDNMIKGLGFGRPIAAELASKYTDADGDLVADVPSDVAEHLSPETIVFSYVPASDEARQKKVWAEFLAKMGEVIGKPVEHVFYGRPKDQLEALRDGKLHVTCFNTGAVPNAVSSAGFVPVCVVGSEDGSFGYTMKLLVPAKSEVKEVGDLRGKKITFTRRTSNSGCKAALVLLASKYQMRPERDYRWGFSLSHDQSILGVARGEFDAAPIAGDLLDRAVAEQLIEKDAVRAIYESERFPPAALGYHHALAPELAEKIRTLFLEFDFEGTGLAESYSTIGATQFVPVSYKDDWAIVREINDSLAKMGS